jgi:alanyl-tRNA synthetase
MTNRLYYTDSYLKSFEAQILEVSLDGKRVYLDRTAFYPTSGGQPFDQGTLNGAAVLEVIDEDDRIAHILETPLSATTAAGEIDWARRWDHMQQHTGQHLLSAVFESLYQAKTVSFHMGVESSTIDLAVPSLDPAQIQAVERQANEWVCANLPVHVAFEDAAQATGLRKASDREGTLRIVSIADLDRSACGGTHVARTGEIGPILLRKLDKIRGNLRIEFLCGTRSIRRARADYEALSQIARSFSAPLDDTPALVAAQIERAAEADKARRRLSTELANARGKELYNETQPGPDGVRKLTRRVDTITEDARTEAQSFTANPKSALLLLGENPPAILLAASKDSGLNAGQWLKAALAEAGGRGGGSPTMAQGSLPNKEALQAISDRPW